MHQNRKKNIYRERKNRNNTHKSNHNNHGQLTFVFLLLDVFVSMTNFKTARNC